MAPIEALRVRVLLKTGHEVAAADAASRAADAAAAVHDVEQVVVNILANFDESGPALLTASRAVELTAHFTSNPGLVGTLGLAVLAPRLRGDWAMHFGDLDAAAREYAQALEVAQRERLVIEEGRAHQGLANLAERRGDIETARAHLDAAGELFAKYGAKLYLDQVLAKKLVLKS